MFNFLKSTSAKDAYEFLAVDMHSHLLPKVDDGSQSIQESLYFIEELQNLGFKKLITTPHIYPEFYPNTNQSLQIAYEFVLNNNILSNIVSFAAEYYLIEHISKNDPVLFFGKNYVLVETSFASLPLNFEQLLFELITLNYTPVIAHPERYLYLKDNLNLLNKCINMGCELQLNINSLGGYYGKASEEMAWELFNRKMPSFLGTDLHHERHLNALKTIGKKSIIKKLRSYPWKNSMLLDFN